MNTPAREELLDRCVNYHGHLCVGQALGVRLALKGMELVGTTNPKEMIVFIENDRCIADAIQVVTGTRIGRRSAKLINYGKMAASLLNTNSGAAFRVSVRPAGFEIGQGEEAIRRILHVPDAELLAWKRISIPMKPEDYPGRPRRTVNCVRCGEKVFDGRDISRDEGCLCVACAATPYYEPLE
jgi:formylmethanofuran dehydrogenase subunit E